MQLLPSVSMGWDTMGWDWMSMNRHLPCTKMSPWSSGFRMLPDACRRASRRRWRSCASSGGERSTVDLFNCNLPPLSSPPSFCSVVAPPPPATAPLPSPPPSPSPAPLIFLDLFLFGRLVQLNRCLFNQMNLNINSIQHQRSNAHCQFMAEYSLNYYAAV